MTDFSSFFPVAAGGGGIPPETYYIEFLAVGGGGGGGGKNTGGTGSGGGGGAGGFVQNFLVAKADEKLNITIGAGGAGAPAGENRFGTNGSNTILDGPSVGVGGVVALGGGGGRHAYGSAGVGLDGGSGGGGTQGSTVAQSQLPTTDDQPFYIYKQGNNGNTGGSTGAPSAGGSSSTVRIRSGSGGQYSNDGAITTIISSTNATTSTVGEVNGTNVFFASGGSAGFSELAGYGGGGRTNTNAGGSNGTANTGGGGGAVSSYAYGPATGTGGAGGSGVVILRMETTNYSSTTTGSPDVYTEGDFTVLVYTGAGTYTT